MAIEIKKLLMVIFLKNSDMAMSRIHNNEYVKIYFVKSFQRCGYVLVLITFVSLSKILLLIKDVNA